MTQHMNLHSAMWNYITVVYHQRGRDVPWFKQNHFYIEQKCADLYINPLIRGSFIFNSTTLRPAQLMTLMSSLVSLGCARKLCQLENLKLNDAINDVIIIPLLFLIWPVRISAVKKDQHTVDTELQTWHDEVQVMVIKLHTNFNKV